MLTYRKNSKPLPPMYRITKARSALRDRITATRKKNTKNKYLTKNNAVAGAVGAGLLGAAGAYAWSLRKSDADEIPQRNQARFRMNSESDHDSEHKSEPESNREALDTIYARNWSNVQPEMPVLLLHDLLKVPDLNQRADHSGISRMYENRRSIFVAKPISEQNNAILISREFNNIFQKSLIHLQSFDKFHIDTEILNEQSKNYTKSQAPWILGDTISQGLLSDCSDWVNVGRDMLKSFEKSPLIDGIHDKNTITKFDKEISSGGETLKIRKTNQLVSDAIYMVTMLLKLEKKSDVNSIVTWCSNKFVFYEVNNAVLETFGRNISLSQIITEINFAFLSCYSAVTSVKLRSNMLICSFFAYAIMIWIYVLLRRMMHGKQISDESEIFHVISNGVRTGRVLDGTNNILGMFYSVGVLAQCYRSSYEQFDLKSRQEIIPGNDPIQYKMNYTCKHLRVHESLAKKLIENNKCDYQATLDFSTATAELYQFLLLYTKGTDARQYAILTNQLNHVINSNNTDAPFHVKRTKLMKNHVLCKFKIKMLRRVVKRTESEYIQNAANVLLNMEVMALDVNRKFSKNTRVSAYLTWMLFFSPSLHNTRSCHIRPFEFKCITSSSSPSLKQLPFFQDMDKQKTREHTDSDDSGYSLDDRSEW